MCGILGTINHPFTDEHLSTIFHRGPDAGAILPLDFGSSRVTLGHRRLAIVELSEAGAEPMTTPDGRHTIIFNGEIYNHMDLRARLDGVAFRGHSDCETMLHYLARFGTAAAKDFNGIFTFAFLDHEKRTLTIARDPFGVKPLYYSVSSRELLFASEMRPLLALRPFDVSSERLAQLLRMRYLPAPHTLFAGLDKVRPGHLLTVDFSGPDLRSFERSYVETARRRSSLGFEDAVGEYGRLFEQAIRRQLMSDVEVGVLLSGGVDSALVAHFARKHSGGPLKAYTVGFTESDDADELADAARSAAVIGLDHHAVRISFDDFFAMIEKCVGIVEEPLATTSLIPMYSLAELAARDLKVVLTGQGADEPLGGYTKYQGEILRRLIPAPVAALAGAGAQRLGVKRENVLRGLAYARQRSFTDRFIGVSGVFEDGQIERLIGVPDTLSRASVDENIGRFGMAEECDPLQRMMALDARMNLADDLLLYTDKITMHHSLECRVPLLDLELVSFIESLPAEYRVRFRQGKRIHKEFARRVLPAEIVARRKKGFQSPTRKWFRDTGRLEEILLSPGSPFTTWFDAGAVRAVLAEHAAGLNRERHIFLLLGLSFWFKQMKTAALRG